MDQFNYTTGKPYSNGNSILLLQAERSTNQWGTYRQFATAGFQVRKGEKGTRIQRVIEKRTKDGARILNKDGTAQRYLKTFVVFNLDQVDRIEEQAA